MPKKLFVWFIINERTIKNYFFIFYLLLAFAGRSYYGQNVVPVECVGSKKEQLTFMVDILRDLNDPDTFVIAGDKRKFYRAGWILHEEVAITEYLLQRGDLEKVDQILEKSEIFSNLGTNRQIAFNELGAYIYLIATHPNAHVLPSTILLDDLGCDFLVLRPPLLKALNVSEVITHIPEDATRRELRSYRGIRYNHLWEEAQLHVMEGYQVHNRVSSDFSQCKNKYSEFRRNNFNTWRHFPGRVIMNHIHTGQADNPFNNADFRENFEKHNRKIPPNGYGDQVHVCPSFYYKENLVDICVTNMERMERPHLYSKFAYKNHFFNSFAKGLIKILK